MKLEEYLEKLVTILDKYDESAVDAAMMALRLDALESSVVPLIFAIFFAIACIFTYRYSKTQNDDTPFLVCTGILAILSTMSFFSAMDPSAWYGIFYPEVWAVSKTL